MPDFMMIESGAAPSAGEFRSLYQMMEQARDRMVSGEFELVSHAAATGATLRRNRLGFDMLAFRQRVLRDVADLDVTTTLLGHRLEMPVMICPMGALHMSIGPDAAVDAARAAADAGIAMAVSSAVEPSLETIATEAPGLKFFQLYVRGDADYLETHIKRAKAAGYQAIIITADAAYFSIRDHPNKSKNFRVSVKDSGKEYGARVTWETIDEIKEMAAPLPVIVKGIQTAEDAALALDHGVDAIEVSNHGGRELDFCEATINALPEIAAVVGGRVPLILDGGIRRGTDVVKALALGASVVGIGRLCAWALGAGGYPAVAKMLEILGAEIGNTMGLLGARTVADLDPSFVKSVPPVGMYYPEFALRDIRPY